MSLWADQIDDDQARFDHDPIQPHPGIADHEILNGGGGPILRTSPVDPGLPKLSFQVHESLRMHFFGRRKLDYWRILPVHSDQRRSGESRLQIDPQSLIQ